MRLRTENIHEYRTKCSSIAQITLDDDFNVPDSKADIELIVKEWGDVVTDSVKVNKDKACVEGELRFALLYIGSTSGNERFMPVKMDGKMPFSENVNLSGDVTGDYVTCQATIEDLSIKAINSRKISVKAIVTLKIICENLVDIQMITGIDEADNADVAQLKNDLEFVQLSVNQRDNYRIRENISLPAGKPDIQEIIWNDVDVRNVNTRLADDGLKLTGQLDVFVMYVGTDDSHNIQWYETTAAFEGSLDISGCSADMIPYVSYQITGRTIEDRPDMDGENRDVSIEVVLDMYSPMHELELTQVSTMLKKLVVRNNVSCRVSGSLQLENYSDLMQICNCTATVQLDDCSYNDGEICAQGAVSANVFYITSNDEHPLGSVHTVIPFENTIKIMGNIESGELEYNIKPVIEQLSATINSAGLIEVKAMVSLDIICFKCFEYKGIKEAVLSEEKIDMSNEPSMTGYIADGRHTLWDVAKKYHTTTESVKNSNHAVMEDMTDMSVIPRGTKLLLVRKC